MDAKINGIFDDSTFIPEGAVELLWKSYLNHLASVACNLLITRWVTRIAGSPWFAESCISAGIRVERGCARRTAQAYRAVDEFVYDAVRHFLRRRHQVYSQGTRQFPEERVFGSLCEMRLQGPMSARLGVRDEASWKAGCLS